MNGPLSLATCAIIAAIGVWLLGGFVLCSCGALLAVGGLASTALTPGWDVPNVPPGWHR
jgi:hypothetical protein